MSFWSTDFMNNRRNSFLEALVKFQYLTNGKWNEATVVKKQIDGLSAIVHISIPKTGNGKEIITALRILDANGKQCAFKEINVVRLSSQGVLIKFEFPIYEKEGI